MNSVVCKRTILLPKAKDMTKWAVVACDQFTAQPDYWRKVEELVGDAPSTLNLILPEIYLKNDNSERVKKINDTMRKYLKEDLFLPASCFVLTERTMDDGGKRLGLVVTVDLDAYDYQRVEVPIRATEDTIPSRLPARIDIRKDAPIELPHILLLIDDREKTILEPLYEKRAELPVIYDFDLNMNGGHIVGYRVDDVESIIQKFDDLLSPELQKEKYGRNAGIELAVGDGNHSMAAAKAIWESIKPTLTEEERKDHPARYAMVEVVNLYDDELIFEPINRVVFDCGEDLIDELTELLGKEKGKEKTPVSFVYCGQKKTVEVSAGSGKTIKMIQEYLEKNVIPKNKIVEYVHGEGHTCDVAKEGNGVGILMPLFEKNELFDYVVNVGNLPKKSFSIGTAESKKYYIEAKSIQ